MNTTEILKKAKELNACGEAIKWLETLPEDAEPWQLCERGDWMLWLAYYVVGDKRTLTRAKCACARLALPYSGKNLKVCTDTIETAERWCDGKATNEELYAAYVASKAAAASAYAVYAAAYAAAAEAAAAADYAAAAAADAAAAAADAAAYSDAAVDSASAYAASYAAAAADVAVYAAAASAVYAYFKQCADEVRKVIPTIIW